MADRPRYVLDTNVMVSGLLFPKSLPGQAFAKARLQGEILQSDETVEELAEVLSRPKFDVYLLAEDRDRFLASLIQTARLISPDETIRLCRDPDDDKLLELAVAGKVQFLVSGDRDLLAIGAVRGILIVTPAAFVASPEV